MKINQKYTSRHELLKTLQTRKNQKWAPDNIDIRDTSLEFDKLTENSGLQETDVIQQIRYLINEKEINEAEFEYSRLYYSISDSGTAAYHDQKYLTKGRKEYLDNIYDVLKNVSTFILLLLAVITFIGNWISNSRKNQEIENIKIELKHLKDSLHSEKEKIIKKK